MTHGMRVSRLGTTSSKSESRRHQDRVWLAYVYNIEQPVEGHRLDDEADDWMLRIRHPD